MSYKKKKTSIKIKNARPCKFVVNFITKEILVLTLMSFHWFCCFSRIETTNAISSYIRRRYIDEYDYMKENIAGDEEFIHLPDKSRNSLKHWLFNENNKKMRIQTRKCVITETNKNQIFYFYPFHVVHVSFIISKH